MAFKNKLNKKVWLQRTKNGRDWDYELDKTKTYKIESVKDPNESKDWCSHFIVRDDEGNTEEVREFMAVIIPQDVDDKRTVIERYLDDNDLYADEVYTEMGGHIIAVHCNWGDWKHTHGWLRDLMNYINYTEVSEKVTEEDGSDCYSATHYFLERQA